MFAGILPQEGLLQVGRKVGVGIAQEAGDIIRRRTAPHSLVVDPYRVAPAKEDVAGLQIPMDQNVRRISQEPRDRFQFRSDGGRLLFRDLEAAAKKMVDEVGVFPGIEGAVEAGHEGEPDLARGGKSIGVQSQNGGDDVRVEAAAFGVSEVRQPGFQGVDAEVLDGEKMVAGGIEQKAGDGNADGIEEAGVAGVEAVVGALGRPANKNGAQWAVFIKTAVFAGGGAATEKLAGGSARGKHFDRIQGAEGWERTESGGGSSSVCGHGPDGRRQECLFAGSENGGGGECEGFARSTEALGGVAVGLDILGGSANVGPERTRNENSSDAMPFFLGALVGGDDRVEAVRGDERKDALIEELQAAEGGVSLPRIVEVADDAFFASNGSGAGLFGEPAGGERALRMPGAEKGEGIEIGDDVGVEQPEGLVYEPGRISEGAAGAENDGLEDGGDAELRKGLVGEMADDGAGGVVEVDEDFANAPRGKPLESPVEHGAIPQRQHRLGRVLREGAQACAQAGGEEEGFPGEGVHGRGR